jgi:hypothetical protein
VKAEIAPYKYPRIIEFVTRCRGRRRASCSATGCVRLEAGALVEIEATAVIPD